MYAFAATVPFTSLLRSTSKLFGNYTFCCFRSSALTFCFTIIDLWPWKPFQQYPLTWRIYVPGLVKYPPHTKYGDITSRETGVNGRTPDRQWTTIVGCGSIKTLHHPCRSSFVLYAQIIIIKILWCQKTISTVVKLENYSKATSLSKLLVDGAVSVTQTAFPRWTATLRRCIKNDIEWAVD